jgi:hypothetical protein
MSIVELITDIPHFNFQQVRNVGNLTSCTSMQVLLTSGDLRVPTRGCGSNSIYALMQDVSNKVTRQFYDRHCVLP